MLKAFMLIFVMSHDHLAYKIIEAPSKEACEAAKPDVLKAITEQYAPDKLDIQCVEVNLKQVT